MLLNLKKPIGHIFDPYIPAEIRRNFKVSEVKVCRPDQAVQTLYNLHSHNDQAVDLKEVDNFSILPQTIRIGSRIAQIESAYDYKKNARHLSIQKGENDPQERIKRRYGSIKYFHDPYYGYGWFVFKFDSKTGERYKVWKVSTILEGIEGLEYYSIYAGEWHKKLRREASIDFQLRNLPPPKAKYLDTIEWYAPSRSREVVDVRLSKITGLPTAKSGKSFMDVDFEDPCEFVVFRIGKVEKRFLHDHVRGMFRLAQVMKQDTDDPVISDPFIIPTKALVDFKDILRYRTLINGQSPSESHIERILTWRIVAHNLDRRNINQLFKSDYDGVEDYLVKPL